MKIGQRASVIFLVTYFAVFASVSVQAAVLQGQEEAVRFGSYAGAGSIQIAVAKSPAPETGTLLFGGGLLLSVFALRRIRPIA
jgi:hypothetical protein